MLLSLPSSRRLVWLTAAIHSASVKASPNAIRFMLLIAPTTPWSASPMSLKISRTIQLSCSRSPTVVWWIFRPRRLTIVSSVARTCWAVSCGPDTNALAMATASSATSSSLPSPKVTARARKAGSCSCSNSTRNRASRASSFSAWRSGACTTQSCTAQSLIAASATSVASTAFETGA